ncbi:MAG: alpha/beta hydrolase [Deltaproteobacteria bacterium]|nr:alpha/beta hydrolase [Deltaproteobacteria bacterium]
MWLVVGWVALGTSCAVEDFFFAGKRGGPYRFDAIDPQVDGDLSAPHPSPIPITMIEEGFVSIESGERVHWVFAKQKEPHLPLILYHHGNGPHIGRFWDRVEILWLLGHPVVIYDYPGFGLSEGSPSEEGCYRAGLAVLRMLSQREDIDAHKITHYGFSMGSAIAFEVVGRTLEEREKNPSSPLQAPLALIGENGWCSIEEMARDATFLKIPGFIVSKMRFDACARLERFPSFPILLFHGLRDRVVPPRQLALLEQRARIPLRTVRIPEASHADLPIAGEPYSPWVKAQGVPTPSVIYVNTLRDFFNSMASP